ncbi:MAG: hypothetical protein MSC30_13865 [Gaiellaceae bacterium MAG52_C11]|nr:hypothetical protein [Candidatus Gaiellasilicea maunaloa]
MSEAVVSVVADVLARLEARVGEAGWPAPEAAFASQVLPAPDAEGETSAWRRELVAAAVADTDVARWREAPVLAAAGYLLDASSELTDRWVEGVARLAEREPFPPDRASFFYRPVELLGLARGAAAGSLGEKFRTWLVDVLRDGEARVPGDIWHRALGAAAADLLGVPWSMSLTVSDIDTAGVDEVALVIWLSTAHPATAERLLGSDERLQIAQLERRLLERALFKPLEVGDAARAAVVATAVRRATESMLESAHAARWQLNRSERDATELAVNLCRRFPRFARQLAVRHDSRTVLTIDDEYDVQDTLHALLQLHFDDIRPEEWAPSYGGSRTRMDFLLKREHTVVETKMTRERLDQRKVVDELVIDKAHYRGHPDCKTLVCFVYDPEHRLTNPDALESDVSGDENGLTTRVVVAPRPS